MSVIPSLFVPDDARVRILVFVGESERVADLVDGRVDLTGPSRQIQAEIHRALIGALIEYIPRPHVTFRGISRIALATGFHAVASR